MMAAETDAARFTGTLWAAIRTAAGPRPASRHHQHFPGAFDPAWLSSLPLPASQDRPAGQPVALLDARHTGFERHLDQAGLDRAYAMWPRTQVLEDIGHCGDRTWYGLAAWHLTRLSASTPHLTCSSYESRYGDETSGRHRDAWYGAVVQIAGAKNWLLGEVRCPAAREPRLSG